MTREEIKNKLLANVVAVTFTKVNGDTRLLNCTLKSDLLPPVTKKVPLVQLTPISLLYGIWIALAGNRLELIL